MTVQYGCTHKDCPVALVMRSWPVAVGADSQPTDEEDALCPECYTPGNEIVAAT